MTDITALAQRMRAAAEKAKHAGEAPVMNFCSRIDALNEFQLAACPANVLALVEALEKAQQSVELVNLQRDKIKRLESDLWDKEQLRKVHSEKSFELEGKVRELEARNQKDFVWRGKEISRLNDEVNELKERLESRTVTVKLPGAGGVESSSDQGIKDWADGWKAYRDEAVRVLSASGIQVIEGEQKNG